MMVEAENEDLGSLLKARINDCDTDEAADLMVEAIVRTTAVAMARSMTGEAEDAVQNFLQIFDGISPSSLFHDRRACTDDLN